MTFVYLAWNQLVVFEEGVFKEILQQMVSVKPPIGNCTVNGSILFNTLVTNIINLAFSLSIQIRSRWLRHRLAHSRQPSSHSGRWKWAVRLRQSVSIRPFRGIGSQFLCRMSVNQKRRNK